jgi:lipopolysaccharide export system protein LptC
LRNLFLILLLGAAAVASWFYSRPLPIETRPPASEDATPLGYYLLGTRLRGTDESGHVAYSIAAERLEENVDLGRLLLEGVVVDYHPPEEIPWVITAARGSAPKDRNMLDLAGGVELRSAPTDGSTPVQITTESLRFTPSTSSAESDQRVDIEFGDWRVDAVGLRTLLNDRRLELESQVHGEVLP